MSRKFSNTGKGDNKYSSHPYKVPVNYKALQYTKIKELQVRMMKWLSYVKDNKPTKKKKIQKKKEEETIRKISARRSAGAWKLPPPSSRISNRS